MSRGTQTVLQLYLLVVVVVPSVKSPVTKTLFVEKKRGITPSRRTGLGSLRCRKANSLRNLVERGGGAVKVVQSPGQVKFFHQKSSLHDYSYHHKHVCRY